MVRRVDEGLGLLLELPAGEGGAPLTPGYAHISNLADNKVEEVGKVGGWGGILWHFVEEAIRASRGCLGRVPDRDSISAREVGKVRGGLGVGGWAGLAVATPLQPGRQRGGGGRQGEGVPSGKGVAATCMAAVPSR